MMSKERRRLHRHNWLKLESKVFIRRGLLKKEWIPVVPFDFSRYGMGVQTDEAYNLGDEVSLSLKLIKDGLEITVPLLRGYVRYKEKHHSRFNYGVEFCFSSKSEKILLDEDLMKIEQTLRQFEASSNQANNVASSA
jgi:Tfp pilus assembly protein PilZ